MAEIVEVRIPDIGDFDAVEVVEVLVEPGQRVAKDQSLITLESDKASMEVPSTHAGTVEELKVKVGDQVGQGAVILTLAVDEAAATEAAEAGGAEAAPEAGATETAPPPAAPPAAETPAAGDGVYASPGVRRLARELEVDLDRIQGSGRKGRITKEDLLAYVKTAMRGGGALPEMPVIDFSRFGPVEEKRLSRVRRVSAQNLHRSWLHVPHVTQHDEADVTELEAFRKAHAEEARKRGFKLTPVAFQLKAVAAALKAFPEVNASLHPSGERLILKRYVHVGVAVDTDDGLVVPVIRDVDRKGIFQLAEELGETSQRMRDGQRRPDDFQGASFTISSLGGIGGTSFTPIVNAPEVAILGVSRAVMRPVWSDGAFVPRLMLPLSLSYDHRVIDGATAARFIVHLSALLGDLRRLLL
ncbi:MAG: dihydrolipoyllysine-residue acetyltransferase [Acidobacteria bacterium]|nr:MAG: dihydrolipoyllysine-residue acetyltransferase [Acidobacteriota bacterium]